MDECTPSVRDHIVEVCRDECTERSVGPGDYRSCVEECVEELKRRCLRA